MSRHRISCISKVTDQHVNQGANFFSCFTKFLKDQFLRSVGFSRVLQVPMSSNDVLWQDWTILCGISTKGDDQIHFVQVSRIHGFRSLTGQVNPNLLHDLNCLRVYPDWMGPGTVCLDYVGAQAASQAFCHLASTRVTSTQKEDVVLRWGFHQFLSLILRKKCLLND